MRRRDAAPLIEIDPSPADLLNITSIAIATSRAHRLHWAARSTSSAQTSYPPLPNQVNSSSTAASGGKREDASRQYQLYTCNNSLVTIELTLFDFKEKNGVHTNYDTRQASATKKANKERA